MLTQIWFAATETIARRVMLMASGQCTPAEYQRMWREKVSAAMLSGLAAALPRGGDAAHAAAMLAPWRRKARANARRLRRK
jgi:hypothetical protein